MPSTLAIQTIQQIKDSIDRPEVCAWLGTMEPNYSKRHRAARYIDGAVKIMDLLRNELTADDVAEYENLYEHAYSQPNHWYGDRLAAARNLWRYVVILDQFLSHERIKSAGVRTLVRDEYARATNYIEPPQRMTPVRTPEERHPFPSTPPSTNSWPPITWYTTSLIPTYYYPGWAFLHVPTVRSDKGVSSTLVWTRE
ncbi:hypothetical protein LXA43DRAFT_166136 [Ganoderma leucocontextum]|nr:hypothetical protein LXA43DRAFT_166136 [Ganoderma leucocontextum]